MIRTKTLLPLLALASLLPASAAPRPNILYFYVDDMGWGSIGPNGQDARRTAGQPHVLTPNIDQLAAQGVNFTRGYGCTVCSPARSSQQSGFHQGHTYADRNNTDNARKAMRADDILMGDALSSAGYVTGYWGKWGYGASQDQNNPQILNLQTLPTSHGYDYVLTELHHVRAHTFFQPTLWSAPAAPGATGGVELVPNSMAAYANSPAYPESPANQSHASYPATGYCDDAYAFAALDFVRAQGQNYNSTGQPFFALLAVQVPHSPYGEIEQLPNWDEAYAGDTPFTTLTAQAKQWAAMCTRVDAHFGNILAALEDPNNDGSTADSIVNNTLVIFQSDNGGPGNNARSEIDANGGLRGSKGSIWEGGIRVPLVMRWPAMITATSTLQAGTNSDRLVDVSDLLPTFCELAGSELPLSIDGVSLASTLTGTGHQRTREFLIHEAQPDRSIIRDNHKLVNNNGALELYDLVANPDESNDIAGANGTLVTELNALLVGERTGESAWFANTYHEWTGADGASTSDAGNWSDYDYTNALNSTTYQTDTGAPQVSWTATIENTGATPSTANADADFAFLGLEIKGASPTATQTLDLGEHTLTGRNEIRLSAHSSVLLDNGTIESLRWVDLLEDAAITGAGTVDATLYNSGTVVITQSSGTTIPGSGTELTSNGGFENGTGKPFNATDDWTNFGTSQTTNARNTSNPHSPSYRGIVGNGSNGPVSPYTDTGYTIQSGDSFTLEFYNAGAGNWDEGVDTLTATVYYIDGSDQTIGSVTVTPTQDFANGYDFSTTQIPATPGSIGRTLLLRFEANGGSSEFAALDDVSLRLNGDPVVLPGDRKLDVTGHYHEFAGASLEVTLAGTATPGEDYAQLLVTGNATLAGTLAVTVDPGFTPAHGDSFTILTANAVNGTFANPNDRLTGSDGSRFDIGYSATAVTLTVDGTTAQGTPYSWLESFGIDGGDHEAADLLDHDGDGMLAWQEFVAGTDPTDPSSFFAATIESPAPGSFLLRWASLAGRVYHVQHSTTLDSFDPLAGPLTATPSENTYTIPPSGNPAEFFRVSVEFPQ